MSYLAEIPLDANFGPFSAFRANLGFIPNLLRTQSLLPRVTEAGTKLENAILVKDAALSRVQKEEILLTIAAAQNNAYCLAAHSKILSFLEVPESRLTDLLSDYQHASLPAADVALLDFALKLTLCAPSVNSGDIKALRLHGFKDEPILDAVLVTALASYLSTLSRGLRPEADFASGKMLWPPVTALQRATFRSSENQDAHVSGEKGPYLRAVYQDPKTFEPFVLLEKSHGFVPNFFRAQTLRPEIIKAEVEAVGAILLPEDALTRVQKESILLVVSAANLNSYCVAVHCNMLRGLGLPAEDGDQIALDHNESRLCEGDKALLDFALKLGTRPNDFGCEDVHRLRKLGFTEEQILECVAVTALNNFSNTLQMGLGVAPDFEPPPALRSKEMYQVGSPARPIADVSVASAAAPRSKDPDAGLVAAVQSGGLEPFEDLVRRHSWRVYRTLAAFLGDSADAQDAMQDAFLKAFQHFSEFRGRSKFSTWLLSIARNTALQRLRERDHVESLDEGGPAGEGDFRPRQVRAWQDDPEQLYSKGEIRELVEKGVMRLPAKYRVAVMLHDIEELSTEESAETLGLSVPALKARLLRGRLMLREWLSPYFAERCEGD